MRQPSRRTTIRVLAAGGGLLGAGLTGNVLRDLLGSTRRPVPAAGDRADPGTRGPVTGDVTQADMATYMALFSRHTQLHRTVQLIPGGVRTITEADAPDLVAHSRRMSRACTRT